MEIQGIYVQELALKRIKVTLVWRSRGYTRIGPSTYQGHITREIQGIYKNCHKKKKKRIQLFTFEYFRLTLGETVTVQKQYTIHTLHIYFNMYLKKICFCSIRLKGCIISTYILKYLLKSTLKI